MFTGIVEHRAPVAESSDIAFGRRLVINGDGWTHRPAHGESISVSGVCLTCISHDGSLVFDVIAQTLKLTTLGNVRAGDSVNLEPSVRAESFISGHFVQGHVDGVGEVIGRVELLDEVRLTIRPPNDLMRYMVPRGSVAVDGVSMTLAEVRHDAFEVALIPTTLGLTTLGLIGPGDSVNIEADVLVRTIAHLLDFSSRP